MCQLAPCQLVSEINDARLAKRASRDTCLLPIPQLEDEVRACQDKRHAVGDMIGIESIKSP